MVRAMGWRARSTSSPHQAPASESWPTLHNLIRSQSNGRQLVPLDGRAAAESAEQQVDTSEAFACTTILGMVVVFFHAMFAQMEAHRREWIIKERSGGNGKTIHNR